jgi:AhpC/TSA family
MSQIALIAFCPTIRRFQNFLFVMISVCGAISHPLAWGLDKTDAAKGAVMQNMTGLDLVTGKPLTVSFKTITILVFLSARCPCSHSHMGELQKLSKGFPQFQFVGIHSNWDEPPAQAKVYFKGNPIGFPVIQDENMMWADKYRAAKTPHTFVVKSEFIEGEIKSSVLYKGGVSNSALFDQAERKYLREVLTDLSQNKPPRIQEGRTLGCLISRGGKENVFE